MPAHRDGTALRLHLLSPDMKPQDLSHVHLVLFMTAGMSLAAWEQVGMFEREVALYRRLRPHLRRITIVTYGGRNDRWFQNRIPGIRIVSNWLGLPSQVYSWLVTRLYARFWSGTVVVKSNQMLGADVALRAARTARGAFIARCGYMLSQFSALARGSDSGTAAECVALEKAVFRDADRCVVTTDAMAETVLGYGIDAGRVHVIPNYVDTDWFAPDRAERPQDRIGFVGRLDDQKNLFTLIEAMRGVEAELCIVGEGPQATALKERALELGVRVTFLGRLPHRDLRDMLNSCTIFVLPSLYEGHPKALLEAMSCGLPVIGTDVPGIREVVRHEKTGWLCGNSASEIQAAIRKLLGDPRLRDRLGRSAREEVVRVCGLDRIVELELGVLTGVAGNGDPACSDRPALRPVGGSLP